MVHFGFGFVSSSGSRCLILFYLDASSGSDDRFGFNPKSVSFRSRCVSDLVLAFGVRLRLVPVAKLLGNGMQPANGVTTRRRSSETVSYYRNRLHCESFVLVLSSSFPLVSPG